jgi:hypothetical protein
VGDAIKMTLNSNGYLGIGPIDLEAPLHVANNAGAPNAGLNAQMAYFYYSSYQSGNFGIYRVNNGDWDNPMGIYSLLLSYQTYTSFPILGHSVLLTAVSRPILRTPMMLNVWRCLVS